MNLNFTLFAQAAVFSLLILFTAKLIWPPLMRAVDERRRKIAAGLAAAERGARSLDDARVQAVQMHEQARSEAQALLADSERRARAIVDEAKLQAKVEADQLIALGRAEAAQAMAQAKAQLRGEVAVLAMAGARQILQREVDERAHAALLEELKARL